MNGRVNDYYHLPSTKALLEHMRTEIGLHGEYLEIFDELRKERGTSEFHADKLNMPKKRFDDKCAIVGQKLVWELVRLAELGLQTEMKMQEENRQDSEQ